MHGKKAYGDYQTPPDFADLVCQFLQNDRNIQPSAVLEPTCGVGNFLKSSLLFDAEAYTGIEINPAYCDTCREQIADSRVTVIHADLFQYPLEPLSQEHLLVLGNPPWATNSMLSVLQSDNLPQKSNFKGLKGLDALTGSSNFDICEYMLLKLIDTFCQKQTTIAMLCKTSVARSVFTELHRQKIGCSVCELVMFDASKIFHITASACLLFLRLDPTCPPPAVCSVFSFDNTEKPQYRFGFQDGQFYSDLSAVAYPFDGKCCFEWRQGVKHDCAKIMELNCKNGLLTNGNREIVQIEPDLVFPLMKSSMFKQPKIDHFQKYVIVTQKNIREETAYIADTCPQTWAYLNRHKALFDRRKSIIYRNTPAFSMFGVGDYAYAPYKVGVSGFYKTPLFSVLTSPDGKPVMTDDTSYFICFSTYDSAYTAMLYLNSAPVQQFLKNLSFQDAKRPFTKKVLERIDFSKVVSAVSLDELRKTETFLGLKPCITPKMQQTFRTEVISGEAETKSLFFPITEK